MPPVMNGPQPAPPPVTLVSSDKYPTLDEALARECYLWIPPGNHVVSKHATISCTNGVILGEGRMTTTITSASTDGVLQITASKNLVIENMTIIASNVATGTALVEVTGTSPSQVDFLDIAATGGRANGSTALRIPSPGQYRVQGTHINIAVPFTHSKRRGAHIEFMPRLHLVLMLS